MKFKSLQTVLTDARETLKRFPLVLISAFIATVSAILLTGGCASKGLYNALMAGALGIPLFLSIQVFIETHDFDGKKARNLEMAGLLVLLAYYAALPKELKGADGVIFGLLFSNAHLLVAFAPFLFLPKKSNAFWQYNRTLFLRIILTFIYSHVIYIGLTTAMRVTDSLFAVKFPPKLYFYLWLAIVGIFNTWFFLGGVPSKIRDLEESRDYPQGLRVFTQFVLIPLVLLYLAILYAYMGKILVTWNLPHGWLSSFIIGVAVLGILTLLLVYPLTDKKEYGWFGVYKKYFYLALFPLIILMVIAITRRISDYGITEPRYFVLLFSAWLFVLAWLFTFKPQSDIRTIPLTLFILVALSTWGPWSAIAVSKTSQMERLKDILTENGLLVGNKIHKAAHPLTAETNAQVSRIAEYLYRNFGLQVVQPWFDPSLKIDWKKLSAYEFVHDLGLEYDMYNYDLNRATEGRFFAFNTRQDPAVRVSGYDYYAPFSLYKNGSMQYATPDGEIKIWQDNAQLKIECGGHLAASVNSVVWISNMQRIYGKRSYNLPPEALTFKGNGHGLAFQIRLITVSGTLPERNKLPEITSAYGYILFSILKAPLTNTPVETK